jgi:16S rRNA A1518/A1519 N6-dimethyltransferase RsmA/KsgA/DIM1 with predicted DNA glycosylase/AP lyase activity
MVEQRPVPWALEELQLGTDVLEIGPGSGLTTACLRRLAPHLTCVEMNETYASSLSRFMAGRAFEFSVQMGPRCRYLTPTLMPLSVSPCCIM